MPLVTPPNNANPSTGAPMAQFDQWARPLNGYQTNAAGVTLGQVDPNEFVSSRLAALLSNNPLARAAAARGEAFAGARGAGVSGSQYAASAENAVYDQMTPIAQAEAQQLQDIRDRNLEALNAKDLDTARNNTQITSANIGASAQRAAIEEQGRQFDIQQNNRAQNREWDLADQRAAARANQRSTTFNTLLQTAFSDPSSWRDPEGVMGFFNTYGSNIESWLSQLFPEYQEQGGAP